MISEESIDNAHLLPLHTWPDEILSVPCERIDEDPHTLHEIAHAMIATMRHHNGVGLAAPQVGILKQIFVTEATPGFPLVFINPTLRVYNVVDMFSFKEGCLSIPGVFHDTQRYKHCSITFTHIDCEFTQTLNASGFESVIIQHEMDHLLGKLFIDDWSKLKQDRAKKKVAKHLSR